MKKILLLLFISGCSGFAMAQTGAWTQKSDIGASTPNGSQATIYSLGLAIGGKGYVGLGYNSSYQDTRAFEAFDPATGKWTARALFGGASRNGAAGFSIGGKAYVGTGTAITSNPWQNDFWAYDTATDTWSQIADFTGHSRSDAVGFSIGNYGYLGTGQSADMDWSDFWQYDPTANAWTQKASFAGHSRYAAAGFSIAGKGYIGTGNDPNNVEVPGFFSDFWEYDPSTDAWTQKANFGGGTRAEAVGFSIGNYGYIGTGNAGIGTDDLTFFPQKDLWQYDPTADTWTRKADLPGLIRWAATGFAVGGNGYIGLGATGACNSCAVFQNDFWQYDPTTDSWQQIAGFEPPARAFATTFSIGNKGYLGLGNAADFWQYDSAADNWTQLAAFPGTNRGGAVGFGVNGLGYITGGVDQIGSNYDSTLWQYDPTANSWAQKTHMPTPGRVYAVAFGLGGKGYVGMGSANLVTANLSYLKDFWEYDPVADSWTQKANFGGGTRCYAIGFSIGGYGYAGTGQDTATVNYYGDLVTALINKKDFWQYDPVADTWTQKAPFAGSGRVYATGFSAAGSGFIGTGMADTTGLPLSDFWQYDTMANNWTRIPDLPDSPRQGAAAFSLGQTGFAGSGYNGNNNSFNDWWQYSPTSVAAIRTTLGTYQLSSACPALTGSGFTWLTDNQGALVSGVNPGGNNLGTTCWGTDIVADGTYRNTYGWFGGTTEAFGAYLPRNYVLTPTTEPSSDVTLRFYCTAQELSDFVAAFNSAYGTSYTQTDIRVVRYDGTNLDLDLTNNSDNATDYTALTPTIGNYGNANEYRYFEVTTPHLSEFAIALSSSSSPLAFSLLNFTAAYQAPATLLSWQTAQEENTASFQIQRSTDGQNFGTIGSTPAAGQSNTTLNYHYTDATAEQAGAATLYYRLQETDFDGHASYSPVAAVGINATGAFAVYPNPATDHVFIQVSAAATSTAELVITDVTGRKVGVEALTLQTGNNSIYLETGRWAPGIYMLKLNTPGAASWQAKLVKQ